VNEGRHMWRVTMFNPDGAQAATEQFPTIDEAETFAAGVRRRHPDWDVDVVRWALHSAGR